MEVGTKVLGLCAYCDSTILTSSGGMLLLLSHMKGKPASPLSVPW